MTPLMTPAPSPPPPSLPLPRHWRLIFSQSCIAPPLYFVGDDSSNNVEPPQKNIPPFPRPGPSVDEPISLITPRRKKFYQAKDKC